MPRTTLAVLIVTLLALAAPPSSAALFMEVRNARVTRDSKGLPESSVIYGTAAGDTALVAPGLLCATSPCPFGGNAAAQIGGDGTALSFAEAYAGGEDGFGALTMRLTDVVAFQPGTQLHFDVDLFVDVVVSGDDENASGSEAMFTYDFTLDEVTLFSLRSGNTSGTFGWSYQSGFGPQTEVASGDDSGIELQRSLSLDEIFPLAGLEFGAPLDLELRVFASAYCPVGYECATVSDSINTLHFEGGFTSGNGYQYASPVPEPVTPLLVLGGALLSLRPRAARS